MQVMKTRKNLLYYFIFTLCIIYLCLYSNIVYAHNNENSVLHITRELLITSRDITLISREVFGLYQDTAIINKDLILLLLAKASVTLNEGIIWFKFNNIQTSQLECCNIQLLNCIQNLHLLEDNRVNYLHVYDSLSLIGKHIFSICKAVFEYYGTHEDFHLLISTISKNKVL